MVIIKSFEDKKDKNLHVLAIPEPIVALKKKQTCFPFKGTSRPMFKIV